MDSYEATRVVFTRIQNIDPENASKIMGLLLIQDHGEKEMIRLAFGPETLLHSVILKARKDLAITSSSSSSSPPLTPSTTVNGSVNLSLTIPNSNPTSWVDELTISPPKNSSSTSLNSSSLPFYANNNDNNIIIDDFHLQNPDLFYQDYLSSSSPTDHHQAVWSNSSVNHRRSCSVSDVCLNTEDPNSGFGWKPCLYYARGYCKNGTSCRFLHGVGVGVGDNNNNGSACGSDGSSPKLDNMMAAAAAAAEPCHHEQQLLRSKSAHQQRQHLAAASQLMAAAANSFPYSPKSMNFLLQQQNETQRSAAAAAAAMMMGGEDLHKFGRSRLERNDFAMNGGVNPASRQIYLTFPADSTFREEDVSSYFSIYGPVQDVRIPYQQKRMFGFVTFVYAETVKLILAKGNPHFVCDARVLVKPYKEKGKVQDKYRKQQQPQVERGDFSPCGTPTGLDSRDPFDLQLGARMFYNSQDMLWRRKLEEQAELQQAIELQSRRIMGLQLLDVKKHHHHRALSSGSPIQSPTQSPNLYTQNLVFSSIQNNNNNNSSSEVSQYENGSGTPTPNSSSDLPIGKESNSNDENSNDRESPRDEIGDLLDSLEHNLPDSPFASPTKGAGEYNMAAGFSANIATEINDLDSSSILPTATTLDMGSFKSFNCQMPRFSSTHGAIGMYAGTPGGPKCPVGI
ncbi:hypothetical protein CsatA_002825 [Cannabis sativa]